jgi:hypothetical protein
VSENSKGSCFAEKPGWRGATKENIPGGSSTEEQRCQAGFSAKTLRAAGLLPVGFVGSVLTARCGDARTSPPRPQPKSPTAGPLSIFRHALKVFREENENAEGFLAPWRDSLLNYFSVSLLLLEPASALLQQRFGRGKWWVATVLPRALRFKRPLHRCNACNPFTTRRRS